MMHVKSKVSFALCSLLLWTVACGGGDKATPAADGSSSGSADLAGTPDGAAGDGATDGPGDGTVDAALGSAVVTPQGGTYELGRGVTLLVPPGAVEADTPIAIELLEAAIVEPVLDSMGLTEKTLLVAFDGKPDGLTFAKPVTVSLPIDDLGPGLPYHFGMDIGRSTYWPLDTQLVLDRTNSRIDLSLQGFTVHVVGRITEELKSDYCKDPETACRCELVDVREESDSKITEKAAGDCQYSRVRGKAHYPTCKGKPTDTWEFAEISEGCVPTLALGGPGKVWPGAQATVTATVVWPHTLDPHTVTFAHQGVGSISPNADTTDSDNEAHTVFRAGNVEGTATITADAATITYNHNFIAINGETFHSEERRRKLPSATHTIRVDDEIEDWTGEFDIVFQAGTPALFAMKVSIHGEMDFQAGDSTCGEADVLEPVLGQIPTGGELPQTISVCGTGTFETTVSDVSSGDPECSVTKAVGPSGGLAIFGYREDGWIRVGWLPCTLAPDLHPPACLPPGEVVLDIRCCSDGVCSNGDFSFLLPVPTLEEPKKYTAQDTITDNGAIDPGDTDFAATWTLTLRRVEGS